MVIFFFFFCSSHTFTHTLSVSVSVCLSVCQSVSLLSSFISGSLFLSPPLSPPPPPPPPRLIMSVCLSVCIPLLLLSPFLPLSMSVSLSDCLCLLHCCPYLYEFISSWKLDDVLSFCLSVYSSASLLSIFVKNKQTKKHQKNTCFLIVGFCLCSVGLSLIISKNTAYFLHLYILLLLLLLYCAVLLNTKLYALGDDVACC